MRKEPPQRRKSRRASRHGAAWKPAAGAEVVGDWPESLLTCTNTTTAYLPVLNHECARGTSSSSPGPASPRLSLALRYPSSRFRVLLLPAPPTLLPHSPLTGTLPAPCRPYLGSSSSTSPDQPHPYLPAVVHPSASQNHRNFGCPCDVPPDSRDHESSRR